MKFQTPMLLTQENHIRLTMDQSQERGLSQGAYLERLLEQQYQVQQMFHQFPSDRNGNDIVNSIADNKYNNNDNLPFGRAPTAISYPSVDNGNKTPGTSISNMMGIGINQQQQQQQQNRMLSLLQERQQQQLMAGSLVGGPSDLSSNLGISALSANVGNNGIGSGIGSGIPSSAWVDGLNNGGHGTGSIAGASGSLYPTEQEILLNAQRFTSLGNAVGGNRLQANGGANGSFGDGSLHTVLGARFCVPALPSRKDFSDMLMAKQAAAAFLQSAQARVPRTTRLPCGARGMKADHNSSTAYFDVPEDARHGQHLLCSHSVCRSAGVKFRFCFYCRKPVTKQNFRSRHLHANLDPNNKKEPDKKKKKSMTKLRTKEKTNGETKKITSDIDKTKIKNSNEILKNVVVDGDDKDLVDSLAALPVDNTLERPSKIRKLSNSDNDGISH